MTMTYSELPNKVVKAANGVDYAYREVGQGTVPLILLQHFRGNLDNWDPALIDALAATRYVVTFDNAGVGGSTGTAPDTIGQMARDAIAFLAAMEVGQADVLGFSIGSLAGLADSDGKLEVGPDLNSRAASTAPTATSAGATNSSPAVFCGRGIRAAGSVLARRSSASASCRR
jgi:hypothetical protein